MHNRYSLPLVLLAAFASLAVSGCKSPSDPEPDVPRLPPVTPSTVLLFDDFDGENGGTGQNNWSNLQNWTLVAGCVDLHGNGFYDVQRGNGLYLDLDGSCAEGATVESKTEFSLASGLYVLEFWLAGNQRIATPDTVRVTLGSVYSEEFVMNQFDAFRLVSRTVPVSATTAARLRFRNLGGDNQGALLDVVRLRRAQ